LRSERGSFCASILGPQSDLVPCLLECWAKLKLFWAQGDFPEEWLFKTSCYLARHVLDSVCRWRDKCPMPLTSLDCRVSELVHSDTRPRPATGRRLLPGREAVHGLPLGRGIGGASPLPESCAFSYYTGGCTEGCVGGWCYFPRAAGVRDSAKPSVGWAG
jgi:hypothetical protein